MDKLMPVAGWSRSRPGHAPRPPPARSMTPRPAGVCVPKRSRAPRRATSARSAPNAARRTGGPAGHLPSLSMHASGTVAGPISLDS